MTGLLEPPGTIIMEPHAEPVAELDALEEKPKKDVYTYASQHQLYSIGWSSRLDRADRLAVGSMVEEYANKVTRIRF